MCCQHEEDADGNRTNEEGAKRKPRQPDGPGCNSRRTTEAVRRRRQEEEAERAGREGEEAERNRLEEAIALEEDTALPVVRRLPAYSPSV